MLVNSTLDLEQVINLVMEKAQAVMNAEASSVLQFNERTGFLECEVALGDAGDVTKQTLRLKMGEGIAGWVAETGESLNVPDVSADKRFAQKVDNATGFVTRSILAVPLKVRNKLIGVAEVINRIDGRPFDEYDLELFSTFCRQVALAIDNARIHQSLLDQQKFRQELEAARIIQESFIPQNAPSCPNNRFQISARSMPASSVGGDLYDFIEFGADKLGIVIGDVSGKGIPAALYMARLISDFRFHTQIEEAPENTFFAVNNLLVERGRRGMFVTLLYLVLDANTGEVTILNAGHVPVLHINGETFQSRAIDKKVGVPLGILANAEFQTHRLQLQPKDKLVCFTDGLIEAKNDAGERYSLSRLLRQLKKGWKSPEDAVKKTISEIEAFAGKTPQHDDLTVVALEWNGIPASN